MSRAVAALVLMLGAAALALGGVGACGGSDGSGDQGVLFDGGADASPGRLGSACALSNTDGGCAGGYHCGIVTMADMASDVCVPDPATPIIEGDPCTTKLVLGALGGVEVYGDACGPGSACMESGGAFECRRLCRRRSDCGAVEVCGVPSGSPSKLGGCVLPDVCDPIGQAGCKTGLACYIGGDNGGRFTSCQQTRGAGGAITSSCSSQRDCAAGLYCAGVGYCRTLCWMLPPAGATAGLCGPDERPCSRIAGAPDNVGVCDDP